MKQKLNQTIKFNIHSAILSVYCGINYTYFIYYEKTINLFIFKHYSILFM